MNGSCPRRGRGALGVASIAIALLASPMGAEEEKDLPSWIPSVGLGFGIQSREIDGSIDAFLQSGTTAAATIQCQSLGLDIPPPFPQIPGVCDLSSSENRASDGAAFDISGQVLGPALSSIPGLSWMPLKPRAFVQGGYAFEYDSRTIAEKGDNPGSFDVNGQNPDLHTRLRANPDYLWYVGGGIALQMPIEFTPVFLKIGGHYLEERIDAVGTIDQSEDGFEIFTTEKVKSLTIGGAGPSFGLEAEVWRFGPIGLQAAADLFVTFPLSGSEAQFELEQPNTGATPSCTVDPTFPCIEPAQFDFDADNIHYLGVASLRFAWLGY